MQKRFIKKKGNDKILDEKNSMADKKAVHDKNKRKRRDDIRLLFYDLRKQIPNIQNKTKVSKDQILEARSYYVVLKKEIEQCLVIEKKIF